MSGLTGEETEVFFKAGLDFGAGFAGNFAAHGIRKNFFGDGAFEKYFCGGQGVFFDQIESAFAAEAAEGN